MKSLPGLQSGEHIEMTKYPGVAAFIDLYLIWFTLIIVSCISLSFTDFVVYDLLPRKVVAFLLERLPMGKIQVIVFSLLNFFIILVPAVILSYYKITMRWLFMILGIMVVTLVLSCATNIPQKVLYAIPFAIGIFGVSQVEIYRRTHRFYITSKRIVFSRQYYLMNSTSFSMFFNHINSVQTQQTYLERLFGCGTVIPITSSGENLGTEVMELKAGVIFMGFSGSRDKKMPRAIPVRCFYSVYRPHEVEQVLVGKVAGQYR